jgi:hypothetical protein
VKAGLAELEHWIYEAGEEVLFPVVWSKAALICWRTKRLVILMCLQRICFGDSWIFQLSMAQFG